MSSTVDYVISSEQREQYREEGYFILEGVVPDHHLTMLREECQHYIEKEDAELSRREDNQRGITHMGKRYFISDQHKQNERLKDYIFSDLMAEVCRATVGPEAYLFWEQYVVKGAEVGMKFSWHQDSGYVGYDHTPYMSCWCALDDMSEENGTVYVLPFSRAGTRTREDHVVEQGSNDKVGYFGDDPGVPVIVPAGSLAVFTSVTFHRSGANTTDQMRRVYLTQYSGSPIYTEDGSKLWGNAVRFVENNKRTEPVVL
jgi:ectoine hydroxylase-related dioxygenase (phytanoyl-CoA dioxygenase family)